MGCVLSTSFLRLDNPHEQSQQGKGDLTRRVLDNVTAYQPPFAAGGLFPKRKRKVADIDALPDDFQLARRIGKVQRKLGRIFELNVGSPPVTQVGAIVRPGESPTRLRPAPLTRARDQARPALSSWPASLCAWSAEPELATGDRRDLVRIM